MLPDLLRLRPLLVERPWGGRRLRDLGRDLPAAVPVGESWEVADLVSPEGERCTFVASGELAGMRLVDVMRQFGRNFMGSAAAGPDGRFPLLVKLLDAREHLSVQVHPPEYVACSDPSVRAKTESWYVVDAISGARLWLDVRPEVLDSELATGVGSPAVVSMLGEVPVGQGDFHHIPAGRVHALGGGVLVFEIQTPSDTTFRIYDWTVEYDRAGRELHPEEALASIVRSDPSAVSIPAASSGGVRTLVETPAYWLREHRADAGRIDLDPRPELRVLMMVAGKVVLGDEEVGAGELVMLPAASSLLGSVEATPGSVLLEAGIA